MLKTLIPLALILSPALIPLAAKAQQSHAVIRVSYADLDLSRAEGRTALDRRLARAVDTVCPTTRPGYVTEAPSGLRCKALLRQQVAEARQQAVARHAGTTQISARP
ncbi:UrcA family protein [Sphingomonas kyeonggiensis]|uniref:UrcA family protein n=1 Tax=Sphingomonas kyeonggiensis TaxID=1268553 RepID=A0A7W6JRK0_9SPHN|nr:UrcA family protein [Sphingomonas kyeonggiensis]MBB4098188.1 UrcA family protein [Sphingomonas kyeonggiensis]